MITNRTRSDDSALLEKAMAAVDAAIARAEEDGTRPIYHFRPPAQWMNDPVGIIFHKGFYHVFYEFNPYGDTWGADGTHWGHTRSRDLVHWEHLPIAFGPSRELGERRCNSGCLAFNDAGTPIIFYNMVPFEGRREHWAVLGDDDLIQWEKWNGNPFLSWRTRERHGAPVHPYDKEDMPFIFREGGRTLMLLSSCKIKGKGVVPIYEAEDGSLLKWRYRGIMHNDSGECPNFMKLGSRWVLIYGAYRWVEYFVGSFDIETLTFTTEKQGVVDYSYGPAHPNFRTRGLYATYTFPDPEGRCIMFGWVSGFEQGRGWHGCLSLPRILSLDKEQNLIQTPAPELKKLRGQHRSIENLTVVDETKRLNEIKGDTMELVAELEQGNATAIGLKLRCSENGGKAVTLRYASGTLNVAGTQVPVALGGKANAFRLHVFLDKSVMEVFVNDGMSCVSRVIYPGAMDLGVSVFTENGSGTLKSLDTWQMKPVW